MTQSQTMPETAHASLMEEIKAFRVPKHQIGVWWLGQNGFIFKTPEGTLCSIDLYLTNSVPELLPDLPINLNRKLPIFLKPKELETDIYAFQQSQPLGSGSVSQVGQS